MTTASDAQAHDWDWELIHDAARYAGNAHKDDVRKGTTIPYLSHLWSVAALVMEHGGDSAQVAAGLLHDVAEDHGGEQTLAELRERFGDDVADMVRALSDSLVDTADGQKKLPWGVRKQDYLATLPGKKGRTLLVSAADKIHNLRAIVSDYREIGPELWQRFNQKSAAPHLWYYRGLVEVLASRVPDRMGFELHSALGRLETLVQEKEPQDFEAAWHWKPDQVGDVPSR